MKKALSILAAFLLVLCMPALAFAEGGNGSGGGNGGGGGNGSGGGNGGGAGNPLVVESASIDDGAEIAVGDSITLVFSKNVCEASVRDANMALAKVTDAQGADVAATVVLADDQVEPDKKNDMVITFEEPLAAGDYTLTAQAGITSKSGDVLAEDYVLHFSVAADQAASASASAPDASASAASASASSASASASASSSAASSGSGSAAGGQGGGDMTMPIVIGVVVVAVIAGAVVFAKKKK